MEISNKKLTIECIACYAICLILTAINAVLYRMGATAAEFVWFAAVFALIAVPIVAVRYIHPRDEVDAGIWIKWSWKDLLFGVVAVLILFIPVALGNHFVRTNIQGLQFAFDWSNYQSLQTPLLYELFIQLICVALPEEFFFRGYLQTAIQQMAKNHAKISRYAVVFSIVSASAAFALLHLPSGNFSRLLTFFPGLLFGFIRYKTNGLLGAIFCHAMCNMMMVVMNVHYF